jgi:septum formation protein
MIVLASQSPRRSEILRQAGISFVARPSNVDETARPGESPEDYVKRVALDTAMAAAAAPGEIVLGADTVVVIDGEILGKPAGSADAARMLDLLAGRGHQVLTGICLRRGVEIVIDCARTRVWFTPLTREEIAEYMASGEPMDKAGAYAIQGLASKFIERIEGSYANVVGLPIELVYRHLRKWEDK